MNGAGSFFVDTNVLLYWMAGEEPLRETRARQWIERLWLAGSARLSWQVIHEFYSNAVRKFRIPPPSARHAVRQLAAWMPVAPSASMLERAWHWCDHAQLNFWDAMIVAAAEQSGARWLLSEDFQAGREFGSVTVVNPFERGPEEFGLA